jgi:hypothetical protein
MKPQRAQRKTPCSPGEFPFRLGESDESDKRNNPTHNVRE